MKCEHRLTSFYMNMGLFQSKCIDCGELLTAIWVKDDDYPKELVKFDRLMAEAEKLAACVNYLAATNLRINYVPANIQANEVLSAWEKGKKEALK